MGQHGVQCAYVDFLRWATQFPRHQMLEHPRSQRVTLLSPLQRSRFMAATRGRDAFLYVQHAEHWLMRLPVERACVSDQLYQLFSDMNLRSGHCMPATALGIKFLYQDELEAFLQAERLWISSCWLGDREEVAGFGSEVIGVPISRQDIVEVLEASTPGTSTNRLRERNRQF